MSAAATISNETYRNLRIRARAEEAWRQYDRLAPAALRAADHAWQRERKRQDSVVLVARLAREVRRLNAPLDSAARLRSMMGVHRRSGPPPGHLVASSPCLTRGPTDTASRSLLFDPLAGLVRA
ncbi:hypothetical protein CH254_20995 [Rhodococcus sp. 06-412-2C]|uniref:hypothetical protein n=1 Tax=unclassified Rhodococcus (in: high G+C Gram-positive bacteria) TaxID=192944 RepID=UPI000B9BFB29|nr:MULTISPECIES: hypothetical protein [unclassified Rhodococcus (in: high G+C Gram-positive bacteria)]OZC84859.1 hypothetical protein CH254_20995 [Rhodococcus sp. 06-412-2C]OZC98511.1 hypothetical protein CH279_13640 [Rhodococcus sp. 06-412-2B]OZF33582.1 hypothetical protein CH295_11435 [Rhodococcus sp. 14-2483-1-2]